MRRFWGRNDQSSSPRFTRDDDQLLALNYENLCDGDYLLRLFVNDPFNNKESINGAMSEPNRNSASTNESSLLNPEIAEDIILFGDSIVLGKLFYHKRLQRELQQSNKFYDSVFLQISRQVMIFEHMALVMAKRCSEPLPSTAIAEGSVEVGHPPKSIAFATLGCCLRLVRSLGDWRLVNSAHLNAILKALLYFMDPSNAAFTHFGYDAESSGLFTEVRFIFMHCIKVLLSGEFLQHVEWNKSKFEEEIRLPMFGIFGLFAVSILTNSSEDMTIATGFLSMLVMLVEERSEKVLRRLKGDQLVAITATSNNNSNPKSFPSKVSSKVKRQLSGKAVSKGPFGSIATEEEVKPPGSSPRLEDRDAQDLSNNNDMQPKLQSHGSGTKLWDKSIASKVALEKDKDAAKKPTKSKQVPENAKLLHEILEPKDVVAVNPLANTVVNYVMEDSAPTAVAVHSNQFSNNDVSPARVHRAGANDPTSHALEIRRVEREIRDSIQSVLVLPKSVIAMLKSLGHSLSSQISSPGKKTLLANKSKEPANPVLTSCSTISSSRVYSCGQNSYGELGLGDVTMRKSFTRISSLDEKGVVSIGAGNEHSLFVTKEGKLITAGYNDNGQCGIGSTQQVRVPTVVQALEDEEIQHVYVYNGCEHTIAVTKEGKVYSFGYNYRGQLGLGTTSSETVPRPIRVLLSRKVVLAACSYHHTIILCADGTVFSCGRNDSGQLGHGDTVDKKTPQAVLSAPKNIVSLSCGQFHTVACTAQGVVYACGKNDYGQLGMDGVTSQKIFTKVNVPTEVDNVSQVCCGYYHTLVLSSSGVVAGFGRNDYGQLGLGHAQPKVFQCSVIGGLRDKLVMMVSAGCYHSVTVTMNGMLYVFGRNNHGQLATGDLDERHTPHPVDDFIGQQVVKVAAGFYHTIVLISDSKDGKKDSQSLIKPLAVDEAIDNDGGVYDGKTLVESFKRDLALVTGAEDPDLVSAAARNSNEMRTSCRDLLTLLIQNIISFPTRPDVPSSSQAQSKESLASLGSLCSSLNMLIVMAWEYLKGTSMGTALPISADDAGAFLQNVILLSQRTLKKHKGLIVQALGDWKEDVDKEDPLIEILRAEINSESISDIIVSFFAKSFLPFDDVSEENVDVLKDILSSEIGRFRRILTTIYLSICSMSKFKEECEVFSTAISRCLVQTYDICFGDPFALCSLIRAVSVKILLPNNTEHSSILHGDSVLSPHIRLLSALGSTLHRHEDVIMLFRKSSVAGFQIYQQFVEIYMHFSKVCIDRRLQGHASSRNIDVRRILTVLELTITNMSKSILPIIFMGDEEHGLLDVGLNLLAALIGHADEMLSAIISASLSEESLGFLRYGTLIPSILPSVLLYCITFAKRGIALDKLAAPLKVLIQKLQQIGKFELSNAKAKVAEKKLASLSISPMKDKDAASCLEGEGKEEEVNEASAEEILYMKREQHQISWWFRLLKLTVTLSSRMVTADVKTLRDTFSSRATASHHTIWQRVESAGLSRDVVFSLCCHTAWHHMCWRREDVAQFTSLDRVMRGLEEDPANMGAASPKALEMCRVHRESTKSADSVYRMLSQSTQALFSMNILHAIEEYIFETISIGLDVDRGHKQQSHARIFRIASNAIKFLFSKRSALVANSGGLSWVETLLSLAKVIKIVCAFVQSATSHLLLYHPLVLPASGPSPAKRRWRRAMLVIMCVRRWSNCLLQGFRRLEQDLVDFIIATISAVTDNLTCIPSQELLARRIVSIFELLAKCDNSAEKAAEGLINVTDLLEELNSITIRSDVLNSIAASVREIVDVQDDHISPSATTSWYVLAINSCSRNSKQALTASFNRLGAVVSRILKSFQTSSSCTLIELQALASAIRLLEILLLINPSSKIASSTFTIPMASRLQMYLFEKYVSWTNNSEERMTVRKGASVRDRNFAIKKCIFALLSYAQAYSFLLLSPYPSTARSLHEVLQGHNQLVSYLQNIRFVESQMKSSEDLVSTPAKTEESKEPATAASQLIAGLPSLPFIKPKEGAKKRFQDIITKPMEFSKNSEGFVVAGEKLLNNCKGTDFSVAMWLYLKSRPATNKTVFVMGKCNHNEAWPIVTLKCDGKLEVLFGFSNEIERLTTEEALTPYTWTHIAVVSEQKRVKIFINGTADAQGTTTKNNSRAVLFPLVLGTMPSNFRSRIATTREGFDGMIAQCKYYSRALSPIHVKVIFDNGPPETVDISAKLVYHLLASIKALLLTIDMDYATSTIHSIADVCHTIFVTDTSRRNRHAALDLLQVILSKNCVQELHLSGWRPRVEDAKLYSQVKVLSNQFCGEFESFHSRLVTYFIRIAGWNWLPFVSPGGDDGADGSSVLKELFVFSPLTSIHRIALALNPDSTELGAIEDRTSYQGVIHGEVSFHVISLLQSLLTEAIWRNAAIEVISSILRKLTIGLSDMGGLNKVMLIDAVGVSLLLGGVPSGGYLGAMVHNYFDDSECRIVNINGASNSATVLSNSPASNDLKSLKIRLSDLVFDDNYYSVDMSEVIGGVQGLIWNTIDALGPRVKLLSRDFLAKCYPDNTFQLKVLLKQLRPVESLVYLKLLHAVSCCKEIRTLDSSAATVSHLIGWAASSAEIDFQPVAPVSEGLPTVAVAQTTRQWFECYKYVESVSDKVISLRFPAEAEESTFGEFISNDLGVAADQDHKEVLNHAGLWGAAVISLAINKSSESADRPAIEYLVSERALTVSATGGAAEILGTRECSNAIQMMHYLRWHIVQIARRVIRSVSSAGIVNRLSFPLDLPFWANVCPLKANERQWITSENLTGIFEPTDLWYRISQRLITSGMSSEVTKVLTTTIRYAVLSFLQPSSYKSNSNLLSQVDFFSALVRNLLCWLEINDSSVAFESIAHQILMILLPSLPYYESEWLEMMMLQVCVHVARKIAVRVLDGHRLSADLLDIIRGPNFSLLRQTAQDQIVKFKSHSFNNVSSLAHNLTQLVSYMEVIQRRSNGFDCGEVLRASTGSGKNQTSLMVAKVQSVETTAPKVVAVKSAIVEVDLSLSASTIVSNAQSAELLAILSASQHIDPNFVVVEVALGVGSAGSECIFETVYCGSSTKLVQSGLMPDTVYQMKCRAYFGTIPLLWSSLVEFRTEPGLLFVFDALKCGPDVVLSDDCLTATYSGDDNWSTLLGSRSFSSGVTTWEIRVNQSSSAYIFIGVATSAADLNTFLGGCQHSWGFIGEQALYHNREKVKVYGETFSTGDLIGVTMDLNVGTLSFSKNKKSLGVAFDKIFGDLFPAVAFYNIGQELQIMPGGFKTTCAHEPIPISPTRLSMDDVSLTNELLLSLYLHRPLSHRLAVLVAEHCNQWCATVYVRCRAVAQKDIFLATESPLLKHFGLVVGERVRTYYGVAEVAGSAFNRIWFRVNPAGEVWFFSAQQIQEGRAKKQLFMRSSYDAAEPTTVAGGANVGLASTTTSHARSADNLSTAAIATVTFDAATVMDLLDPCKWTDEMDEILLSFYFAQAQAAGVEPWQLTSDQLFENFRALQQQLSRVVLANSDLTYRWGISGPKRKAVIARLGLLRALNQLLEMYLPFCISDNCSKSFADRVGRSVDEFAPIVETFQSVGMLDRQRQHAAFISREEEPVFDSAWPALKLSWDVTTQHATNSQELWTGPLHALRRRVFVSLKLRHFFEVLRKSATRAAKTDDDYDYPENLPHVKINRLKSFRAREAAELMAISGEDLLLASMFCQLHRELRQHSDERLRISYTHPMDDGQSRAFKIKFEGEGVDDYGGPYREIFGQICAELQLLHPSGVRTQGPNRTKPVCFLPFLMPSPNWTADGDIEERYVYIFQPSLQSALKLDLCRFLGQVVGLAIRSRITLDLALPSFIWKILVGESLSERDLASFDQSAYEFVQHLRALHESSREGSAPSSDALEAIRDLTWSMTLSDGQVVDLVPDGRHRAVLLDDLPAFLTRFVQARFDESRQAVRMFRCGLTSIVPESALSLLSCDDLRRLVCGSKEIDIDRLQMNTEYDDEISPNDPHIVNFWEVLRSFDEAEKSAFLKFVWARPSLPPEGVEFAQKMRVLSTAVEDSTASHDAFLPKAHTCFFSINLPKYSTKEIMAEKLRYAIFNCTEMDGDFRTTEAEVAGWGAGATLMQSDALGAGALAQDLL